MAYRYFSEQMARLLRQEPRGRGLGASWRSLPSPLSFEPSQGELAVVV